MRRALWTAAAAWLAVGCASRGFRPGPGERGEVVVAEGWAPVDAKDPIGTRRRALAEAQKKAVERVVGVFISAKTRVDQAVTVDQKILANVGGYIRRYEVLGDREEEGFHKTRIRALVLYQKVGDDLRGAGLLRPEPPPGNPKVAVLLRGPMEEGGAEGEFPDVPGVPAGAQGREPGGSASAAVRRALLERGFSVVDLNDSDAAPPTRSTETAAALSAGRRLQADLIIVGEARARPVVDARLGDFHSFRARLSVRVLKPATGEVVSERSQEASAIDPSAEIARDKSLENAGQLAGEALADELSRRLRHAIGVTVRIAGLGGFDGVRAVAESLRTTPGVLGATLSGWAEGVAELQVTTDGMAGDDVAADLLRMQKFRFRTVSITPYEIELEEVGPRH